MLSASVLGKLYIWWGNAKIFALLSAVAHVFGRAWENSAVRRIFCSGRVKTWFRESLAAEAADESVCFLLSAFRPAAQSSAIFRACGRTRLLRFDVLFGAFTCFMFCVPHPLWHNQLALAAAIALFALVFFLAAAGKRSRI